MRIAWVANGTEGYGIARATTERMKQVREGGHDAMLCAVAAGSLTAQAVNLGFPTHVLGMQPARGVPGQGLGKLLHLPRAIRCTLQSRSRFAELFQQLKPDVVHVNQPALLASAAWAASKAGAATVWEMANAIEGRLPFGLNRRVYQAACNRYRVLPIANSAYTASTLGSTRLPAIVIHHATDVAAFDPSVVDPIPRATLGVPENALVAVVCARMTPSKGQEQILRAVALSRLQSNTDLRVVFVGGAGSPEDDRFIARLLELAKALDVTNRVVFVGPSGEVARFYAMADFSISFRIDPEPFGLSIIESMLMRKPPIVHALGGPAEIVEHGVSGWHVLQTEPESLAAIILHVTKAPASLRRYGDAARAKALQLYDPACQIQRYLEALRGHTL